MKSSLSFTHGSCVEVASLSSDQIGVRDSKDADGPVLAFTPDEWDAFLDGVRNGDISQGTSCPGWRTPRRTDYLPTESSENVSTYARTYLIALFAKAGYRTGRREAGPRRPADQLGA
jgi:hypothetical protein